MCRKTHGTALNHGEITRSIDGQLPTLAFGVQSFGIIWPVKPDDGLADIQGQAALLSHQSICYIHLKLTWKEEAMERRDGSGVEASAT